MRGCSWKHGAAHEFVKPADVVGFRGRDCGPIHLHTGQTVAEIRVSGSDLFLVRACNLTQISYLGRTEGGDFSLRNFLHRQRNGAAMTDFDYDLFVIGGGSGGVRAARIAATHGARVGIAEEYRYGGTCVIRGCVPKKLFVYASKFSEEFEDAEGFGWSVGERSFSWNKLIAAKDQEITRLEGIYRRNLENTKVEAHDSRAVLEDAHTVRLSVDRSEDYGEIHPCRCWRFTER